MILALLLAVVTVDLRDYVTQGDPGYRHRGTQWGVDVGLATDGYYDLGEWSQGVVVEARAGGNVAGLPTGSIWGVHYVTIGAGFLVGPMRDLAGPWGPWRCFADVGGACYPRGATYPPQAAPMVLEAPVLTELQIPADLVTAQVPPLYPDWLGHDVWLMDAATCTPYVVEQRVWQRVRVFVVDRMDFGRDLGARTDVLVLEQETREVPLADSARPARTAAASRLERYYFVRGWGLARQSGANAGADGRFNAIGTQGDIAWSVRVAGDFHARPICAIPTLPWMVLGR